MLGFGIIVGGHPRKEITDHEIIISNNAIILKFWL